MPITKKAKAEAIERDYRINKRPDISDETTITWAELGALQARIAELEHKLANYQAAADGDTHWCAECKMKDERIAELEKRATRLAQEYCELAEVWQKHECNPAPPEEVSYD